MARWMRALPGLERCERPTSALLSASTAQPGRLAQGPDEKLGFAGFTAGAIRGIAAISSDPPRSMRLALGRDVLRRGIRPMAGGRQWSFLRLSPKSYAPAKVDGRA